MTGETLRVAMGWFVIPGRRVAHLFCTGQAGPTAAACCQSAYYRQAQLVPALPGKRVCEHCAILAATGSLPGKAWWHSQADRRRFRATLRQARTEGRVLEKVPP